MENDCWVLNIGNFEYIPPTEQVEEGTCQKETIACLRIIVKDSSITIQQQVTIIQKTHL